MNFLPGFLILVLFSVIIGVLFHIWKGGSIFRLLLLLLFAIFGFVIGHFVGVKIKFEFFCDWLGSSRIGIDIFDTFDMDCFVVK